MRIRRIRVFERDTLRVDQKAFLSSDLEMLARYEEREKLGAFEIGWKCVRFKDYVGIFAAGDLVLEILPKAEAPRVREDPGLERKWAGALLRMLAVAYGLPLELSSDAGRRLAEGPLLDIFIGHFLDLVQGLVRGGLAKGYRRVIERVPGLRGKPIVHDVGLETLVHRDRLLCEYDIYDRDTPHNRILARALAELRLLPLAPRLIERAGRLLEAFPEIGSMRVTQASFVTLSWDRRTFAYRPAIDLARLILLGLAPLQVDSDTPALALLFKMNDLFEAYIGALVQKAGRRRGWHIALQQGRRFWEGMSIVPDIIIDTGERRVVLDTKWKVLAAAKPSPEDLRQMNVYERHFNAESAFLVYPKVDGLEDRVGRFREPDGRLVCGLAFVPLFDGEELARNLGDQVLDQVMAE